METGRLRGRMIPARTIGRKRDGETLEPAEFSAFLNAFDEGRVSDAQMASFLMAVAFQGLDRSELDVLVEVMIGSGSSMSRKSRARPRVDKHSTGGVGDKVSLVLAPLAAELGLDVPMMSGRGLGHTGGTLDKLEAIPGFSTELDLGAFEDVVQEVGFAMIGQTDEIAPLDRRLYALRGATGTVPAIELIASSIMSKKLAEDLDGLVLDVKVGGGSFLVDPERSQRLAETMVDIGRSRGVPTVALLTRMEWPIGRAVGNALEVAEAIQCLRGDGPDDLTELTCQLVGEMLIVSGLETDPQSSVDRAREALTSGRAVDRFQRMVAAQGGDARVVDHPDRLPTASEHIVATAGATGVVATIDPLALGWGVVELGGGRRAPGDSINPAVGFQLAVTVGDEIREGDVVGRVHAADPASAELGRSLLTSAIGITPAVGEEAPLIYGRIGP